MQRVMDMMIAELRRDIRKRSAAIPLEEMRDLALSAPSPRDAYGALSAPGCGVIAELKRAVPNKGMIAEIIDPAGLAQQFERGGACIISCQTEQHHFQGKLCDVRSVREAVSVPVMCKDFILEPYQVHEARYYGADIVPLVAEIMDQARLEALVERVESVGMVALVDVSTLDDADRALRAGARVIGINARPISTLSLNYDSFQEIAPQLPSSVLTVALSGVRSPSQLITYATSGADAVVIGESLVTTQRPVELCRQLVAAGQHPSCPSMMG